MKSEKYRIALLILAAIIIGGAIWWFMQTPGNTAAANPQVVPASKTDAPKAVVAVNQVAPPNAPAVAAHGGPVPDAAVVAQAAQDRADLNATIADIVRLAKNHDLADIYATYWPPGYMDQQKLTDIRKWEQSYKDGTIKYPEVYKTLDAMDHIWEVLGEQTPKFNAAGDEATFMQPYPDYEGNGGPVDGGPAKYTPLIFIKVDGKWYIKL